MQLMLSVVYWVRYWQGQINQGQISASFLKLLLWLTVICWELDFKLYSEKQEAFKIILQTSSGY